MLQSILHRDNGCIRRHLPEHAPAVRGRGDQQRTSIMLDARHQEGNIEPAVFVKQRALLSSQSARDDVTTASENLPEDLVPDAPPEIAHRVETPHAAKEARPAVWG